MQNTEFNRSRVIRFLIWTFALAYAIQIGAAYLYNHVNMQIGQLVVAAMMFIPALGVLVSGAGLKGLGWNPKIRKNIRYILIAWLSPVVLTGIGAALYFLIFPGHFDLSGGYLVEMAGGEALAQMNAQGVSYTGYLLIQVASAVVYAPFINAFLALGEEIGWRGFLYPQLKARFGRRKGWLLGGCIWGAWHWPLIWLIGYEYGASAANSAGYAGFPVSGMLLFCVVTIGWGILHDWLYERSGSLWLPSLLHGAINAVAAIPLTVCAVNTGSARLLGPVPNGILSVVPFLVWAAVLFFRAETRTDGREL